MSLFNCELNLGSLKVARRYNYDKYLSPSFLMHGGRPRGMAAWMLSKEIKHASNMLARLITNIIVRIFQIAIALMLVRILNFKYHMTHVKLKP